MMNILVTAGKTVSPIDRVRYITNIFSGRTGARIALHCHAEGHHVTLVTSSADVVSELKEARRSLEERWRVISYRTFAELQSALAEEAAASQYDAIVHSAAVGDYQMSGVFTPAPGTRFDAEEFHWRADNGETPAMTDVREGKVKSSAAELWCRLTPTPKLIDQFRTDWGFRGVLVKFKLEVEMNETDLIAVAEESRRHSTADLIVANTLEHAGEWAHLGPVAGEYQRVARSELPARLLAAIAAIRQGQAHE